MCLGIKCVHNSTRETSMSDVPQIQKILVAMDFSEPAERALQYARSLVEKLDAELHLLHVIVPVAVPVLGAPTVGYIEDTAVVAQLDETARKDMEAMFDASWKSAHRLTITVCVGTPVFEILRYASEQSINLIVLGTLGRTGLSHLILGSVAESIVRKAHCPVLSVH